MAAPVQLPPESRDATAVLLYTKYSLLPDWYTCQPEPVFNWFAFGTVVIALILFVTRAVVATRVEASDVAVVGAVTVLLNEDMPLKVAVLVLDMPPGKEARPETDKDAADNAPVSAIPVAERVPFTTKFPADPVWDE